MTAKPARRLRGWLLGMTVIAIVVGALSAMPLLTSFMVFDAGETQEAWTMFFAIWAVPAILIAGLVYAWIGYAAGSYGATRAGLIVSAIPMALLGVLAAVAGLGIVLN